MDKDAGENIGRKIKGWRLAQGMSQSELEERAGLNNNYSHGVVSRWELGKIKPCGKSIRRVAKGLGIDVEMLMTVPPPPPVPLAG